MVQVSLLFSVLVFFTAQVHSECAFFIAGCASVNCDAGTGSAALCTSCEADLYFNTEVSRCCTLTANCVAGTCTDSTSNFVCTTCDGGYYKDSTSGTCKVCTKPAGCATVVCEPDDANVVCSQCDGQLYLDSASKRCCTLTTGCAAGTCTDSNTDFVCSACLPGYWFKTSDNTCQVCTKPTGCASVSCDAGDTNTKCLTCDAGLYWDFTNNRCCTASADCMIGTCSADQTTFTCSECDAGFWLQVSDTSCQACTGKPLGCATITCGVGSINPQCQTCDTAALYLDLTNMRCCTLTPNCAEGTCTDSTSGFVCTACQPGFWLRSNDNFCQPCSKPAGCSAVTCDPTSDTNPQCDACDAGLSVDTTNNRCCTLTTSCNAGTCEDANTGFTCTECVTDYFLDPNFRCCTLPDGCSAGTCASGTNPFVCSQCDSGLYLDADNNCCPLPSGCAQGTCTSSPSVVATCTGCESGQYLDADGACCFLPSGCTAGTCGLLTSDITCSACESGKYLDSDLNCCVLPPGCIEAGCGVGTLVTQCITCESGKFLDSNNNCCTLPAGCNVGTCPTASTPAVCSACVDGQYLDSAKKCCELTSGCATGTCSSGTNPTTCTACVTGLYLDAAKKCCTLPSGCATGTCTTTATTCLTCETGKFYDTNKRCCTLPTGCVAGTCPTTTTGAVICTECATGRILNTAGECELCLTFNNQCILANCQTCLECAAGYVVGPTGDCVVSCGNGILNNGEGCDETTSGHCNLALCRCDNGFKANTQGVCTDINECNVLTCGFLPSTVVSCTQNEINSRTCTCLNGRIAGSEFPTVTLFGISAFNGCQDQALTETETLNALVSRPSVVGNLLSDLIPGVSNVNVVQGGTSGVITISFTVPVGTDTTNLIAQFLNNLSALIGVPTNQLDVQLSFAKKRDTVNYVITISLTETTQEDSAVSKLVVPLFGFAMVTLFYAY